MSWTYSMVLIGLEVLLPSNLKQRWDLVKLKQTQLSQPNSTSTQVGSDKVISWTTTTTPTQSNV